MDGDGRLRVASISKELASAKEQTAAVVTAMVAVVTVEAAMVEAAMAVAARAEAWGGIWGRPCGEMALGGHHRGRGGGWRTGGRLKLVSAAGANNGRRANGGDGGSGLVE